MTWWLVEEQYGSDSGGLERVHHWIVRGRDAKEAFTLLQESLPEREWLFLPNELEDYIPDYIWAASDGSSVAYEIRKLSGTELWAFAEKGAVR